MKSKVILNGVVLVSACALGTVLSLRPWQVYKEQRTIADEAVVQMRRAEAKKADLLQKRANYESPLGRGEACAPAGIPPPTKPPLTCDLATRFGVLHIQLSGRIVTHAASQPCLAFPARLVGRRSMGRARYLISGADVPGDQPEVLNFELTSTVVKADQVKQSRHLLSTFIGSQQLPIPNGQS